MHVRPLERPSTLCALWLAAVATIATASVSVAEQQKQPNILVIWGDDIGTWNISHNNRGMMGYSTPNIDRIAREGVAFTDYYGQQSCTAGRAAFYADDFVILCRSRAEAEDRAR